MQQLFDLQITKLTTIQFQDPQQKTRKHFHSNRQTLWSNFGTPSGRLFSFDEELKNLSFTELVQKREKKTKQLDLKQLAILRNIDMKLKILEDSFQPKLEKKMSKPIQNKIKPNKKIIESKPDIRLNDSPKPIRTQSATPMMKKTRPLSRRTQHNENQGLVVKKCPLYVHCYSPKNKCRINYTVSNFRKRASSTQCKENIYKHNHYKGSVSIAKWDQDSEASFSIL